jgi:peptidoglycan/LPS O-acetylase OafA/YrhL
MVEALRAVAALSVFLFHTGISDHWSYLAELNSGLTIFFLISGFLLYRSFARARLEQRAGPALLPYAARRLLRIVPAYWAALVIVALVLGRDEILGDDWLAYFGFAQVYDPEIQFSGLSQAWTLNVEIAFYAMLPFWAFGLSRIPFRTTRGFIGTEMGALAALFALSAAYKLATGAHGLFGTAEHFNPVLPSYLDQFVLGMALAVVSVSGVGDRWTASSREGLRTWTWWLLAAVLFAVAARILVTTPFDQTSPARLFAEHEINGLAALCLLIPAVFPAREHDHVRRAFLHPAVLWLGLVSYGFYIWHGPILNELGDWPGEGASAYLVRTLVAFFITAGAAAASWYLLEKRAIGLGQTIRRRSR